MIRCQNTRYKAAYNRIGNAVTNNLIPIYILDGRHLMELVPIHSGINLTCTYFTICFNLTFYDAIRQHRSGVLESELRGKAVYEPSDCQ